MTTERQYLPPLVELIDRLAIDQIKEVLALGVKDSVRREMEQLSHDIDLLVAEKELRLTARLIRIITALAQLNLHIWHCKDGMVRLGIRYDLPGEYEQNLEIAHQLNGVKNQLKNLLLQETGDGEGALQRNTAGAGGWEISIG